MPIVLIEEPGGHYWHEWDQFIRRNLLAAPPNGLIDPDDTCLYYITHDAQDAVDHIRRFYRNYHSCRYLKDELYLRIHHAPTPEELAQLNTDFRHICLDGAQGGGIEVRSTQIFDEETLVPNLPRLVLKFDRRSLAHLRQLIDRLNTLPSLPPMEPTVATNTQDQRSDRGISEIAEEESVRVIEPPK
jgi:hypothetical protein